jgi:hypothetical protein
LRYDSSFIYFEHDEDRKKGLSTAVIRGAELLHVSRQDVSLINNVKDDAGDRAHDGAAGRDHAQRRRQLRLNPRS